MCGRYYIDDDTAREIEKLINQLDEKIKAERRRDIHPAEMAPVILKRGDKLDCRLLKWGFPVSFKKDGDVKSQILINARCETSLEKPAFRDSVLSRRAVIPAAGFYEWNKEKEMNIFNRPDAPILYMAGCYNRYEDGDHFVILTTAANESMEPVHNRMPLILEKGEIDDWIGDGSATEQFLRKQPAPLNRTSDYEQMSLEAFLKNDQCIYESFMWNLVKNSS